MKGIQFSSEYWYLNQSVISLPIPIVASITKKHPDEVGCRTNSLKKTIDTKWWKALMVAVQFNKHERHFVHASPDLV